MGVPAENIFDRVLGWLQTRVGSVPSHCERYLSFDVGPSRRARTNPPKRERVLEWQERQDFPICPNPDEPDACNVYKDLQFPEHVYEHISEYYEHKSEH